MQELLRRLEEIDRRLVEIDACQPGRLEPVLRSRTDLLEELQSAAEAGGAAPPWPADARQKLLRLEQFTLRLEQQIRMVRSAVLHQLQELNQQQAVLRAVSSPPAEEASGTIDLAG